MGHARLQLAVLSTATVLAAGIGVGTAWATPLAPNPPDSDQYAPSQSDQDPPEAPAENRPAETPPGSPTATGSPTMADPTTALHKALTKTAQASSSAGNFDFTCGKSTGSGRYSSQSKPSVKMDARISDLNVNGEAKPNKPHLILDNNVFYVNTDGLVKTDPKTPWFKIGVDQLPGPNGRMIANLVHGKINDPATIRQVVDSYQDVKKVGEESVNGVKTTHYTGTYNAAKARAALEGTTGGMTSPSPMTSPHGTPGMTPGRTPGGEMSPGASPGGPHAGAGRAPNNLLFDIWVDNKDDLVRKSHYRSEPDAKTKLDITTTVTNYNQPVKVSAPPPNQTKQLDPALLEKWSGS